MRACVLRSTSNVRQLCAVSEEPKWKPRISFLPSGVVPMITRMHSAYGFIHGYI